MPMPMADISLQNKTNRRFLKAVFDDDYELVGMLLKERSKSNGDFIEINKCSQSLKNPLSYCNSVRMAELLLQNGADVNMKSEVCESPLMSAILRKHAAIVDVLIKQGGKVTSDIVYSFLKLQNSKLYKASKSGYDDGCVVKEMRRLILNNLDHVDEEWVNTTDEMSVLGEAVKVNDQEFIEVFLEKGFDVNGTKQSKETPLTLAAKYNDDESGVELLLKHGADVNVKNYCGRTALSASVKWYNIKAFTALVEAGSDVNTNYCSDSDLNLLSTMLRCKTNYTFTSNLDFILHILNHGGKASGPEDMFAVHKSIALGEFELTKALINSGSFSPSLLPHPDDKLFPEFLSDKVSHFSVSLCEKFDGVFSPLCMALLCGHVTLAQNMVNAGYLTLSDLNILPQQREVRKRIIKNKFPESIQFLDKLASAVPSLFQLSFACVSDLAGAQPGRQEVVSQLGLPFKIQKMLMFKCEEQNIWEEGDSSSDSESDEDDTSSSDEENDYYNECSDEYKR